MSEKNFIISAVDELRAQLDMARDEKLLSPLQENCFQDAVSLLRSYTCLFCNQRYHLISNCPIIKPLDKYAHSFQMQT
jgi:hypothetical protein